MAIFKDLFQKNLLRSPSARMLAKLLANECEQVWSEATKFGMRTKFQSHTAAQQSHKARLRDIVKNSGNKSASALISTLNPVIRRWCNYHRCCTNLWPVWSKTNPYFYRLLWKWAQNRHTRQSRKWIYAKYWKFVDERRTVVASNGED